MDRDKDVAGPGTQVRPGAQQHTRRRLGGGREEHVPRHGSAVAGAEVDLAPAAPVRGRALAGWSIRRKLTLLVMIPLVALLVGGGVLVTQIALEYRQAHIARVYTDAIVPALQATDALRYEFRVVRVNDAEALRQARAATNQRVDALRDALDEVNKLGGTSANITQDTDQELRQLDKIPSVRGLVDRIVANEGVDLRAASDGIELQFATIQDLISGLTGELSTVSPDRDAAVGATIVASISRTARFADQERLEIRNILTDTGAPDENALARLSRVAAEQDQSLTAANEVADTARRGRLTELLNDNKDSTLVGWRAAAERRVRGADDAAGNDDVRTWDTVATERLNTIVSFVNDTAQQTRDDARRTEVAALWRAGLVAAAVLGTLAIVTALLAAIARSVTQPLRRLRSGAVEVASVQLPAAVARIEQDGTAADITLPPVLPADSPAGPETIEVAHAVDDLGAEAVRLATAQVRLRRALDEAFVSMSRRSQAMVEKQLAIIDELESQEQDPDQLRNLFRLDHLAARMRRYNDNLLVLAGSAVRTRATAPVKIAELFRAATSEMEQYERVRLQPVSGASIAGTVAGELVHLLAELLDNAAMYSPPSSAIVLSAAFTSDGGLQIEVLDAGVGISPGEIDRLNARLAQPESIDTQVPSRMGLFVVARLARRGGFNVTLQARPDASGTVAMVRVPPHLVMGAPGSTGETPGGAIQGPRSGQAALPQGAPTAIPGRSAPALEPAADAGALVGPGAAAAAAAAAGVRSAVDGDSPLPRRRKPPRTSSPPGLPPAAIAAASTLTPPGGLFTPSTPPSAPNSGQFQQPGYDQFGYDETGYEQPAYEQPGYEQPGYEQPGYEQPGYEQPAYEQPAYEQPAYDDSGYERSSFEQPEYERPGYETGYEQQQQPDYDPGRFGDYGSRREPAATSPNGVSLGGGDAPPAPPTPDAGLPRRDIGGTAGGQAPSSPYARTNPATGLPMDRPVPATPEAAAMPPSTGAFPATGAMTGAISTTGSSSASALPSGVGLPPGAETPARGISRSDAFQARREEPSYGPQEPLTAPSGGSKAAANPSVPPLSETGNGAAPAAWDEALPTELAARAAAASAYRPADPDAPMIGENVTPSFDDPTPIFDQISVWFSAEPSNGTTMSMGNGSDRDGEAVIDLRERSPEPTTSRWAALGDQRWLATNARAAAAPDTAGTTEQGLPRRRPGANLLPSAASAAPPMTGGPAPSHPEELPRVLAGLDADLVRGRLGSYQRGLATARRARAQEGGPSETPAFDSVGASLFTAKREPGDAGQYPGEQGGDQ
jgi:signal transduction histidine kinase